MDCIILAGNRENYRAVSHKPNKAFLEVSGQPILKIMLLELEKVPEIDRILLVGPERQIADLVANELPDGYAKPLLIFEQQSDLVANILEVVDATQESPDPDRYVLILPSDIPLMTCEEVREFVAQCDMSQYDMVSGVTTSEALSRYYPTESSPGVRMAYFFFREGHYRINNMHMVRPSALDGAEYIRKTYAIRYQKEFRNILKMIFQLMLVALRSPAGIFIYLGMSSARWCHEMGWEGMSRWFRRWFPLKRAAKSISKVLGTRFHIAVTKYGGAAIDVDNEADYEAIVARFDEWIALQRTLTKAPDAR